ncbi:MAG: hypothetical protein HY246_20780 [Proteobacteria bacterium]|nr:hypothetical protein [Pseudomonadota bacterium]
MFTLERAVPAHPLFARKGEASPSAGLSCREVKFGQLPSAFVPTAAPAPAPMPMPMPTPTPMLADMQPDLQMNPAPAESSMAGLIRRHTVDPEALARVPSSPTATNVVALRAALGMAAPVVPVRPVPEARPLAPSVPAAALSTSPALPAMTTAGVGSAAAMPAAVPATHAADANSASEQNRRRQLTVRLCHGEFRRLVGIAERTRRTFQDILSSATKAYLDIVAPKRD